MNRFMLSAAFCAVSAVAGHAATISTMAYLSGGFGGASMPNAFGQTFTLDNAATLQDFSFWIDDGQVRTTLNLMIYAWDALNSKASGAALTTTAGATPGDGPLLNQLTVSTNNVLLGAGQYIAFIEGTSYNFAVYYGIDAYVDAYSGGRLWYQNNGGDVTQATTASWTTRPDYLVGNDLAFAINYIPPPLRFRCQPACLCLAQGLPPLA